MTVVLFAAKRRLAAVLALCALLPLNASALEAPLWPRGVPTPIETHAGARLEVEGGFPSNDRKIVAIFYHDPWVRDPNQGNHLCSGLWISADYVLTAAHCTCSTTRFSVSSLQDVRKQPDSIWVAAKLKRRFGNTVCRTGRPAGDDLAALQLKAPLPLDFNRRPCRNYSLVQNIRLIGDWKEAIPGVVDVAGYGFDGDVADSQGEQRIAPVSVNSFYCSEARFRRLGCQYLQEFVAGAGSKQTRPYDSCKGDSGAPAFTKRGDRFIPVGITSRGLPLPSPSPSLGKCGQGGIYTHLGLKDVRHWLTDVVKIPPGSENCSAD